MKMINLLPVILVPSVILLIPAAMMGFRVEGWAWSPADFVVMWMLIAGALLAYQVIAAKAGSVAYRVAVGVAVATGFVLVWVNGAVGLIGSENNPANVLYFGVLLLGGIGAAIARLTPAGMARTLYSVALAQFLVPVIALLVWPGDFSPGVPQVFGLNSFFVLWFVVSGILFQHAAKVSPSSRPA